MILYMIFYVHLKLREASKFVQEDIGPDKEALAKTFPWLNEFDYECLCLVDGELPDKLAQNGTTLGEITMVIYYAYQHSANENKTRS